MQDTFLTNYSDQTFLEKLKDSFRNCKSFSLSVSFIVIPGLNLFRREIEEALERGVKGRIITSTYQNFTDIPSLKLFKKWMDQYPDQFECHLDFQCFGDSGYHSKGYLFEYPDSYEFIVGSTNITYFALQKNVEWNVSLVDKNRFSSISSALKEFDDLWKQTLPLTEELIEKYKVVMAYAVDKWDMDYFDPEKGDGFIPNAMQRKALKEIRRYRDQGVSKALVIAATGSGKTVLAALDARNYGAKHLLYIVHEQNILVTARKTFETIFGSERSYGFYTGERKELDNDFIFASTQMLVRHLDEFSPTEFDYIIYDEVHHIMADGGQKIFQHFRPGFLLGLTATPERMDEKDVAGLFEENIPFELRLRDAINNDLVVPFHYYAIRDEFADYSSDDKSKVAHEIVKNINVDFIVRQIDAHKIPGKKLNCLAFCTSVQHCFDMAEAFESYGYPSVALTGKNTLGERIKAFNELQDDHNPLEIICAIDILNEGVDIPAVNMVLFLRPTESSTIFLQQLGRGLRKYPDKEYVTVLDFIGNNYERSAQIALALGTLGKTTYTEKSYLKEQVMSDFKNVGVKGVEIFFDDLSKKEIISYLDKINFNRAILMKTDYLNFKKYLNQNSYVTHMEYLNSDLAPDLLRFIKGMHCKEEERCYFTFLKNIAMEENLPTFSREEVTFLSKVTGLLPLIRMDEYLILKQAIEARKIIPSNLYNYFPRVTKETIDHALFSLRLEHILSSNNELTISLTNPELVDYMEDLLSYGLERYKREFGDFEGKFRWLGNYYKGQIMRAILRRPQSSFAITPGTEHIDGDTYCYVTLKKDKSAAERTNYKDKFISPSIFQWESVNNTTKENAEGQKLLHTRDVYLFVRKMKDENGVVLPFTYMGKGKFDNCRETFNITATGERIPTLTFDILLEKPIDKDYWFDFEIPEPIEEKKDEENR